MRNTDEEFDYWRLWIRLPPIAIMLILLASIGFSATVWNTSAIGVYNITLNSSIENTLDPHFAYRWNVDTSNTSRWAAGCSNIRFLSSDNTTIYNATIDPYFCRSSAGNTTFYITANNGTIFAYILQIFDSTSYFSSQTVFCNETTGENLTSRWFLNNESDECGNNTLAKNGTVNFISNPSMCKFGACANLSESSFLQKKGGAVVPLGTTSSYMTIWTARAGSFTSVITNSLMTFGGSRYKGLREIGTPVGSDSLRYTDENLANAKIDGVMTDMSTPTFIGVSSASAGGLKALYLNTTRATSSDSFGSVPDGSNLTIGSCTENTNNRYWFQGASQNGTVDEAELGGQNRSVDWMNAKYLQTWATNSFIPLSGVLDTAPNVTYIAISPPTAYANTVLMCNATLTDNESSTITAIYNWFKNGTNQTALAGTFSVQNNTNTNVANLSSGLVHGDNWSCSVTAYDGELYSATNYSSNITILNTDPTNATITNLANATIGHSFNFNATAQDVDGGSDIISWNISSTSCSVNSNSSFGVTKKVNITCISSNPRSLTFSVSLNDTYNKTANTSETTNTFPDPNNASVVSVSITPNPATDISNLTCNAGTWSDADGDIENTTSRTWRWFRNGTLIVGETTTTLNHGNFSTTDLINCEESVYAENWTTSRAITNSSVIIIGASNKNPIISSVSITPSVIFANSTMFCTVNASDNESTSLRIFFNWFKNGVNQTALAGYSNVSTNITTNITNISAGLKKGDNWSCYVLAYDGALYSSQNNTPNKTIANSPPTLTTLSLTTNGSAHQLGPVQSNITYYDVDLDAMTVYYTWFSNGTNASYGSQSATNGSVVSTDGGFPIYNVSDNWNILVYAYDGTNYSIVNTSANTTITNYITNIVINYTDPEYDIYSYKNEVNMTLSGGSDVSAYLNIDGVNHSVNKNVFLGDYNFWLSLSPPQTTYMTSSNYTWFYTVSLANSSTYTQNLSYLITVNPSGLFSCNSTVNVTSLNFTFLDFMTSTPISVNYVSTFNSSSVIRSITGTDTSYVWCIDPTNASFDISLNEIYTATNYAPLITSHQIHANNTTQFFYIYMLNSSLAYPTTLSTYRLPNIPLTGVQIKIYWYNPPFNYTEIQTCTTNNAGSCLVYLIPNSVYYGYNLSIFSSMVGPEVLSCAPGSVSCFRNFYIGATTDLPGISTGQIKGSCAYSSTTGYLVCNADGSTPELLGFGLKLYQLGASVETCSNTSVGNSATLSCGVPQINNTMWNYILYSIESKTNEPITTGYIEINTNRSTLLGRDSWFIMLFLFVFLAAMGAAHPTLGLSFGILGLILTVFLGIVPFNAVTVIITLAAVTAGVLMWKLRT